MDYRAAIIGCGGQAKLHAKAYEHVSDLELVACCDIDEERRSTFAVEFELDRQYSDYETMLAEVRPDVVHLVTPPSVRVEPIRQAARAGVKALIVEKPLTLWPSELRQIQDIVSRTKVRIVVNTQRRYLPYYTKARDLIASGKLGDVRFVRASTFGGPLSMGPHLMDSLLFLLGDVHPTAVWSVADGAEGYEWDHPAPSRLMATYWFDSPMRAFFECNPDGLGTPSEPDFWMNMQLDVWGTSGRLWITQRDTWGYELSGASESTSESVDFHAENVPAQADFTQAVADWLDEPEKPHLCRLETARPVHEALFAALASARSGRRVTLPTEVRDSSLRELRQQIEP